MICCITKRLTRFVIGAALRANSHIRYIKILNTFVSRMYDHNVERAVFLLVVFRATMVDEEVNWSLN